MRKRPSIVLIALLALTVLTAALGLWRVWAGRQQVAEQSRPALSGPSQPVAPDFALPTLDGGSVRMADLRGKVVLLNFWATWCPPCRVEIPHFQEASTTYNGQVLIVGVDDGESRAQVAPFAHEMGITYPVPLDSNSEVARHYRVNSLPTTFFIDADGVIQHIQIGLVNGAMLAEQIERLIRDS